ncbi:MAG: M28 family peptidase [Bacteroidota bacterium]
MIKNFITRLLLILIGTQVYGQSNPAKEFAATISEKDLRARLTVLASDKMEGRETGEPGQKKAAKYIRKQFKKFGLKPVVETDKKKSYYQSFNLYRTINKEIYLQAGDQKYNMIDDILFFGSGSTDGEVSAEAIFLGDGPNMPEDLDLSGKVAVIVNKNRSWRSATAKALEKGALATIVVLAPTEEAFRESLTRMAGFLRSGGLSANKPGEGKNRFTFMVGPAMVEKLFSMDMASLAEKEFTATAPVVMNVNRGSEAVSTENVLGYMEGTDLKDEIIVITSHYDHIGRDGDEINNGADDDGSGTTTVLELAQAFSKAKARKQGPRRSILFMTVTGEEKGLLGSDYYTKNPVFPLEQTVTNLNIDMVGRVDPDHEGKGDYVYVIGSDKLSSELHAISEKANKDYVNMDLDYRYNDENDPNRFYYRSDHYNFAKNNIPIIFYFNGVHADYHQPTDTIEKINFPMMKQRANLVFYTAWELANRDERVAVDK